MKTSPTKRPRLIIGVFFLSNLTEFQLGDIMDIDTGGSFCLNRKGKMDLHVFLIERKRRIKDIAEIKSPHERLCQLDELEKWADSEHRPGWVIGHRLVAIEKLRARKEILFEQKGE